MPKEFTIKCRIFLLSFSVLTTSVIAETCSTEQKQKAQTKINAFKGIIAFAEREFLFTFSKDKKLPENIAAADDKDFLTGEKANKLFIYSGPDFKPTCELNNTPEWIYVTYPASITTDAINAIGLHLLNDVYSATPFDPVDPLSSLKNFTRDTGTTLSTVTTTFDLAEDPDDFCLFLDGV